YLNRTFFGISAYGISAAARQYYNKDVSEMTLAEIATTIGILPRPNAYNPLQSQELALAERSRVLRRMRDQGMIDNFQYDIALDSPITAKRYGRQPEMEAPYIAELVRQEMVARYGELATVDGFEVYTTIDSRMQQTANIALQNGLENYDRKHGYRGRENHLQPPADGSSEQWLQILSRTPTVGTMEPAFVQDLTERSITALRANGEVVTIDWDGIRWAKRFINSNAWGSSPRSAGEVAEIGDLIRIKLNDQGLWELGQVPAINGGLVTVDPNNGAIRALAGGYDFNASKFNRVTQAQRQPGSNFKPFLYAAALENGYTAASLINDAPLARSDYRPENFNREFLGPLRLKYALTQSKNLVSLRLYDALGSGVVLPYVGRFGFNISEFPQNDLTVAIGSHAVTPLEIASGYTVFANGGHRVEPYLIQRIDNFNDGERFRANPMTVCEDCNSSSGPGPLSPDLYSQTLPERSQIKPAPRVIDERVAYIMNSILRSVITEGSGRPVARAIDRQDLAGKTGTTNGPNDLWFSGFNSDLVTTVYVGFDQPDSLGESEQAATVALPIWIDFMKVVLEGTPERNMAQPDGLVTVRINRNNGLRACPDDPDAIFEVFREDNVPDFGCANTDLDKQPEHRNDSATDFIF
ncbi:MAG: penicillin-binding transpeptidase domain-containing protein, partial [Pseudohongiellaceae bacterium]